MSPEHINCDPDLLIAKSGESFKDSLDYLLQEQSRKFRKSFLLFNLLASFSCSTGLTTLLLANPESAPQEVIIGGAGIAASLVTMQFAHLCRQGYKLANLQRSAKDQRQALEEPALPTPVSALEAQEEGVPLAPQPETVLITGETKVGFGPPRHNQTEEELSLSDLVVTKPRFY
ncbi:hypothetical protein ACFLZ1_02400 [Patescibacteria group bacterium]